MKLTELLESKIYTQKEMEQIYKEIPSKEKIYQKKKLMFDVELVKQPREVITKIDGKEETKNKANKGDYILTGTKGEKYVLSPNKVKERYIIKDNKAESKPVKTKGKILDSKISFIASWGEKMNTEIGDTLINNNGEYYRIEKSAFKNTYDLVKKNG